MADRDSIVVWVRLYAELERFVGAQENPLTATLPAGSTVAHLLALLGIPSEYKTVVGVNGRLGKLEQKLQDNDQVELMPYIAGGSPIP